MLGVGRQQQLRKSIAQESNRFSFRKVYSGEMRERLDESILIRAAVKIPSDMRTFNVTKGTIKKNI